MKLYTNQDLIDETGKSISTITRDRAAGKLGGQVVGRAIVYTQAEVNAYKAGKTPPKTRSLYGVSQVAGKTGVWPVTIHAMIEDARLSPIILDINSRPLHVFTDDMLDQVLQVKHQSGRPLIDDGAHERVVKGEDGRFHILHTTGKDGRPLHYKTYNLAVATARRALREPLLYKQGDLVYAKVGATITRAVVQHDVTSICLAAWVIVHGTKKPVLAQKKQLKGVVNQDAIDHPNYIIIKGGRDV